MRRIIDRLLDAPWFFERVRNALDPDQVPHLRQLLARVPHESVLDVGCGVGNLCGMTDAPYVGIELSADYVRRAQARYGSPTKRFVTADALALDGSLGRFDVVSMVNVIHHFADHEVDRLLRQVRHVEPRFLFLVDVALERSGWAFRTLFRRLDRGHFFRTTAAQRSLLEASGARVVWEDWYVDGPRIYPHSAILAAIPPGGNGAEG
jgi:SAM-dependent methyltransferase